MENMGRTGQDRNRPAAFENTLHFRRSYAENTIKLLGPLDILPALITLPNQHVGAPDSTRCRAKDTVLTAPARSYVLNSWPLTRRRVENHDADHNNGAWAPCMIRPLLKGLKTEPGYIRGVLRKHRPIAGNRWNQPRSKLRKQRGRGCIFDTYS